MRVVVVGSGVAGASTAFALAGGGAEVVVVDRVRPGQATAAGAGIVQPWSSGADGPVYDLYAAGAAYYPELVAHTPDGPVDADAVVVACGAWSNEVLAPLGVRVPVEPQRGQIVHLGLSDHDTAGWPSVLPAGSHYLVPFGGGRVVVGATRETGTGFDARVTAGGLREVLDAALAVAPGLAAASVMETRVGLRPLATRPVLGRLAGLVVNAGFGPAGLTMAPLAGAALAQLVLTGTSPLDLTPFAPPAKIGA